MLQDITIKQVADAACSIFVWKIFLHKLLYCTPHGEETLKLRRMHIIPCLFPLIFSNSLSALKERLATL